jgi:hypothetical protein
VKEAEWKVREAQRDELGWGENRCPSSPLEGWPGISDDDEHRVEWSASESRVMTSYPPHNRGWPSVEGGIEVAIEVCSDVVELEGKRSTCRSLMIIDCLSVPDLLSLLCHSAIGTSLGSCACVGNQSVRSTRPILRRT